MGYRSIRKTDEAPLLKVIEKKFMNSSNIRLRLIHAWTFMSIVVTPAPGEFCVLRDRSTYF